MPTQTTHYDLNKPNVNSADDEDLWGDQLNDNFDVIDTNLFTAVSGIVPTGSVLDFAGTAAPTGWLFCYGQAIDRTTYATLFTAIGTTFGAGDGSTTFNLPDLRGRVAAGKDDMGGVSANRLTDQTGGVNGDTLGDTGGSEVHTLTEAELAAHNHRAWGSTAGAGTANIGDASGKAFLGASAETQYFETANASSTALIEDTGSDDAHNNVQPTIVLNKIIKT